MHERPTSWYGFPLGGVISFIGGINAGFGALHDENSTMASSFDENFPHNSSHQVIFNVSDVGVEKYAIISNLSFHTAKNCLVIFQNF